MSKKSKLNWEYVTKRIDEYVYPGDVHRVHKPLEPSLSHSSSFLYLRACVQGVDKNGTVVKYLYCTRDGRFFVHKKDGWYELMPHNHSRLRRNKAVGGSAGCPQMREFGDKYCHRCVAFAWLDRPVDLQAQLMGLPSDTKWEVDHLNGDHKNWTADNLQWVTDYENRRRAGIAKRMRKAGIDPKRLTPMLMRGIYSLPTEDDWGGVLIGVFLDLCHRDSSQMTIEAIRRNVAIALDALQKAITAGQKLPITIDIKSL